MAEGKRGWTVVRDDDEDDDDQVASSESSKHDEPRMYHLRKNLLREATGAEGREEKGREKIKATPEEVLASLPLMTKQEKKQIQRVLQREEEDAAVEKLQKSRILQNYASSSSEDESRRIAKVIECIYTHIVTSTQYGHIQ